MPRDRGAELRSAALGCVWSDGRDSRCGGLAFTLDVQDKKGEREALPPGSVLPQKPSLLSPASAEALLPICPP